MLNKRVAIVGTVGLPARYGGFETLAENLVKYHASSSQPVLLTVYCSSKFYPSKEPYFLSAQLKYIRLNANGFQSVFYDFVSMLSAVFNRSDVILLLGVSGAIGLPIVRLLSSARIVTNLDGIEWRREKWNGIARFYLRFSERLAVYFSHEVISDNKAIAEYVYLAYREESHLIPYGGDHAKGVNEVAIADTSLPVDFALAVCRVEPENNVHMILESFSRLKSIPLIMIGNWNNSEYGLDLRRRFSLFSNIYMLDPIYDLGILKYLRSRASFFVHGHSAGGTNPSLVEAMHFGKAIFAYDCAYNHYTTEDKAIYFKSSEELLRMMKPLEAEKIKAVGRDMLEIAERCYTWRVVASQYFSLLVP